MYLEDLKNPEAIQAAKDINDRFYNGDPTLANFKRVKQIIESDTERFKVPSKGSYDFKNVPLSDPRVWALFARGDTKGIFQLEKQLGQDWAKRAKPRNIEELAVLISILRPGPLESGMSDQYVKRKNGDEAVEYFHPALEDILDETYGCLIYQEQAMNIAVKIAGFTPVQADNLRKAIGKKKPEEMAKVKVMFMEEAAKRGIVTADEAAEIFGWIEKSVRYSFNKSHAVSYALISYLSAYQKVHFPTEFYTSWLTYSDWKPSAKEEIYDLVQNARLNGIVVLPPDIRRKNVDFEIIERGKIIFGLSHIRGVGSAAVSAIIEAGHELDTFIGFIKAIKKLKRNIGESLIKSGACDCYGLSRTQMLRNLHAVYGRSDSESLETTAETKKLTQPELNHFVKFVDDRGIAGAMQQIIDDGRCVKKRLPTIESKVKYLHENVDDTNRQKSIWEKLYLGLNLTCSAADDVDKLEPNTKTCRQAHFLGNKEKLILHVVIDSIRVRETSEKSKNPGAKFCYINVSDNTGALGNVVCWPEKYEKFKMELCEDTVVTIYGRVDCWNGKTQIVLDNLKVIG